MDPGSAVVIAIVILLFAVGIIYFRLQWKRHLWIENYAFPISIQTKVKDRYPHLDGAQAQQVMDGLREYFHVCRAGGKRMVAMPSQVVDTAWHEFILFTRAYQAFCKRAFGRYLHHTPAEAMEKPTLAQQGIKRAWRISCSRADIDRNAPDRLPVLFALDRDLEIADGFTYAVDCQRAEGVAFCAAHISCASGCGGDCGGDAGCGGGCGGD